MIEHISSLICGGTSIDQETNSISVFNILEQLTIFTAVSDKPIRIPIQFEILSLFTRQDPNIPARGKMRVLYFDPDHVERKRNENDLDLSQFGLFRRRIKSNHLELFGPGKYEFVIELNQEGSDNWEKVASLPLLITYQERQDAAISNTEE